MSSPTDSQTALASGAIVVELGPRSWVELTGDDRATLLNGFCTNDIKRLAPGGGCEAFLTSVQGKTLAYMYVFCQPECLVIDIEPGEAAGIIQHLDRYIIREDVALADRSGQYVTLLVAGPRGLPSLAEVLGFDPAQLEAPLSHVSAAWEGKELAVRRTDYAGSPSLFVSCPGETSTTVLAALVDRGFVRGEPEVAEMARIEAGTPRFGRDVTSENLPQEVDRNDRAISFKKGCYLGQETVARIDALGHVNRLLRGVRFPGTELPQVGCELRRDGKAVGRVTSAVWSHRLNAPLALAYVRRGAHQAGTRLESDQGEAEVIKLPLDL